MNIRSFGSFLFVSLLSLQAEAASVRAAHVEVELISEREAVAAHETQYIGIRFKPDPEWHVYWKNPGDSGLPPKVEWKIEPSEATASDFIFPAPERILVGPLVNYGYKGDVLILARLDTEDLKAGSEVEIQAQAKWLVCKEECVPGKATLNLKLPVVDPAVYAKTEGDNKVLFAKTIAELPIRKKPNEDPRIRIIHEKNKDSSGRISIHVSSQSAAGKSAIAQAANRSQVFFFPESEYGFEASTKQITKKFQEDEGMALVHDIAQKTYTALPAIRGVLKLGDTFYELEEIFDPKAAARPTGTNQNGNSASNSILLMLVFAFIGGLILNLMPCILPVLSIKVMELIGQSGEDRAHIRKHGLVYAAGVLVSFWILAAIFLILRSSGASLGWGFQLQSPAFVGVLAVLFFLMGLNLMGVFEIGTRVMGVGSDLTRRSGFTGSFFTGVLTTVAATPCSAPFMGTALGFALTQPAFTSVLVLTFLALGLSFPYLAFSFFPATSKILPRPGKWMETLKQLLAFPLFGTVIWLVTVVSAQAGSEGSMHVMAAALLGYFVIWLNSKKPERMIPQVSRWTLIAVSIVIGVLLLIGIQKKTLQPEVSGVWSPFTPARLDKDLAAGKTVLVNLTADWCVTCKVNETVAFDQTEVKKALSASNISALLGDWTNGDPMITSYMMQFGRNSVPVYLLYRSGAKEPEILPQILTPALLLKKLQSK